MVRDHPGRLSALHIFHSKLVSCGAFVWACSALNIQNTAVSGAGSVMKTRSASTRSTRGSLASTTGASRAALQAARLQTEENDGACER
jgi:hypothetical protein